MAIYRAEGRLKGYDLYAQDSSQKLLSLEFPKWYSSVAHFEWNHESYDIKPRRYKPLDIDVIRNGKERASFELDWKSVYTLKVEDITGITKYFTFKKKGAFNKSFELIDFQLQAVLEIRPLWRWQKWRFEYHIETFDLNETEARNIDILPLICYVLWCTRQLMRSKSN